MKHSVTRPSDKDVFGCTVSDCRPGYFVTSVTNSGMAKRLGIEVGDKIIEVDSHHIEKATDTDSVGALLRQRKFDLVILRADKDRLSVYKTESS